MFFLKKEEQLHFDAAQALYFDEDDIHDDVFSHIEDHLTFIPEKYHEAISSKTLFRNKDLHQQYNQWCKQVIDRYNKHQKATYTNYKNILTKFNTHAQKVFSQSFHDGKIVSYRQQNDDVTLLLDMCNGFTVEALIELTFHNATTEGQLEGYYIYDELIETNDRFALRVLSSVGWPYEQWTIRFENVSAKYVYRPALAIEPGQISAMSQFIENLDDDDYYILKGDKITPIELMQITEDSNGIYVEDVLLGEDFAEAIRHIYCATYKDPYAHFSEPLPVEELREAVFGEDNELRVRAFNTIFALGEEVAPLVNEILRKSENEGDEMYFIVLANHFDSLNCLNEDVKRKWIFE